MSKTLTLIDAGWESILTTAKCGKRIDALNRLTQLLARPDVPAAMATEGHRFAGELALELGKYATARRHLKAATKLEPTLAEAYFLAGRAWEEDPDGCDRRAAICFKKAATLDAKAQYRVAFGRAAARCGKVKLGTREMLAATEQASGDITIVRIAVSGLLEAGKAEEARQVIAKARFLCPDNYELAAFGERVKFETARQSQKSAKTRENTRYAQDAHFATDGDRVTLPFVRLADDDSSPSTKGSKGGTVRRDAASFPRPHLASFRARKADR
jgi:tetratricopeptide (TPR) repeat protein